MVSLANNRQQLSALCQKRKIRRLAAFGSILRDDFRPESDLDLLVEFEPGKIPGFAFFEIQDELSALFGRKVDLNTPEDLPIQIRNNVREHAEVLYEQP